MREKVTRAVANSIVSQGFLDSIEPLLQAYDQFESNYRIVGLPIGTCVCDKREASDRLGLSHDENYNALYTKERSSACDACRTGVGSVTFFLSLKCTKECFYCFNNNQEDHEFHRSHVRDIVGELSKFHDTGMRLTHIAVTGGEPLVHFEELREFITQARIWYPASHIRVYSCGDLLTPEKAAKLTECGLDELRLSIKYEAGSAAIEESLDLIRSIKPHVKDIVVEIPVIPGHLAVLEKLLCDLDELGIKGINLLEFCFPFANLPEFADKGFALKAQPYETPMNYWYAGGLPIDGSEQDSLRLMEYAVSKDLGMYVHYCSLENKHSGQVYQMNAPFVEELSGYAFSQKDFFFKSVVAYGKVAQELKRALEAKAVKDFVFDPEEGSLEFNPDDVRGAEGLPNEKEVYLLYYVVSDDGGDYQLRNVRADRALLQDIVDGDY